MARIARAGRAVRANPASRSPPAGSGARFRRQSLAIPETRRPRNCQAREHGQTRRLDRHLPAAAPDSAAGSRSRSRQPAGQGTAKHASTGNPGRLDRSLPVAAPGSAAGTRSRSRQPAGQGTAKHATTGNPMKPGASIGETQQPFPGAPDGDHRQSRPRSSGKPGVSITTCRQRRQVPLAVARDPGNPPAKAPPSTRARATHEARRLDR